MKNEKTILSSILFKVCGWGSVFPLLFITFYAWIYRNFLGFGRDPLYDVTSLEYFASIAFVVGVSFFSWEKFMIIDRYSSLTNQQDYRIHLEKELEKHGVKQD